MKSNKLVICLIALTAAIFFTFYFNFLNLKGFKHVFQLLRSIPLSATDIDASINAAIQPLTTILSSFIFYKVEIFGTPMPLIVLWLVGAAIFFYFLL